MNEAIERYHDGLAPEDRATCARLAGAIERGLPSADGKVWHGHPVWFLEGNPIVGYAKRKDAVRLMFWSGRSFDEPDLQPEGTFQAAGARFTSADQIDDETLARWLRSRKDGRVRTYVLAPARLRDAEGWLVRQRTLWDRRLDQFDDYVTRLKETP